MNRRKLLSLLGAAPAVAAIPSVAEITPEPVSRAPILGELRWEAVMDTIRDFPTSLNGCRPYAKCALKIYDGKQWVDEDSQAGVDVKNKVLRS